MFVCAFGRFKVLLCNELGKAPLKWSASLSARRLVNYINTRKSKLARTSAKKKTKGESVNDESDDDEKTPTKTSKRKADTRPSTSAKSRKRQKNMAKVTVCSFLYNIVMKMLA